MADDLRGRMADLAREPLSQDGSEDTLQHVVDAAVELVGGCDAASISRASRKNQMVTTSASTSRAITRADELQIELGQGPCVDAVWRERLITVTDLSIEHRWPRWGPRVTDELGFRSMTCVRLFTHDDHIGALNLFAYEPNAFNQDAVDEAVAIAAQAAVAFAATEQLAGLQHAIDNRTVIGQASGLMMAYYGLSALQAFGVLRRLSNERNSKLADIAYDMVQQHERDREQPTLTQP